MKRMTICLAIFFTLTSSVVAAPPAPQYHIWLSHVTHQNPCAEKRKPQPHAIQAAVAVLQPADLPDRDLDPTLSGDALTPQLRVLGATDAHKVLYWAQDWSTSPLTVYNIVVVFWDVDGAQEYMHHLAVKCAELDGELVTVPLLADETNGCRRGGGMSDIYTVDYRHGNAVSGIGVDGTLTAVLEYAALSLRRIEHVIGRVKWN